MPAFQVTSICLYARQPVFASLSACNKTFPCTILAGLSAQRNFYGR